MAILPARGNRLSRVAGAARRAFGPAGARAPKAAGRASGAEGSRTPDLSIANAALSQLSYGPVPKNGWARQDSNL